MSADNKSRESKSKDTGVVTLFGEKQEKVPVLRDRYVYPPFNVLLTSSGDWRRRQKVWRDYLLIGDVGIQGEQIEEVSQKEVYNAGKGIAKVKIADEAVFDPFLLETLADFYCPLKGTILDPFNGSHVSGCLFQTLGYSYTGIDIRQNIIDQNNEKVSKIIPDNPPRYLCGDSDDILDELIFEKFDMINSCPPYAFLVKYSKKNPLKGDLSLLNYDDFVVKYTSIIKKCAFLLNDGGYACFTIGQVRSKDVGDILPFKEDTIAAFKASGMKLWNEAQLIGAFGSAGIRAANTFEKGNAGQLVNVHQTVLVFKKI